MKKVKTKDCEKLNNLFVNWEETLIWSYLQGYMGEAWADSIEYPESGQIIVGDFCFFAGKANIQLVSNSLERSNKEFLILVPQNDKWENVIEQVYGANANKRMRYAIKKENNNFNRQTLSSYVNKLDSEYQLELINETRYEQILNEEWSKDLCSQYKNYEDFSKHGLGIVGIYDDNVIAGASSYTYYKEGIEIEIDTKTEYRRQGLATACAAKLILECIEKGIYPSWDAQNKASVALAEKLGYHFDKEYVVYEIQIVN